MTTAASHASPEERNLTYEELAEMRQRVALNRTYHESRRIAASLAALDHDFADGRLDEQVEELCEEWRGLKADLEEVRAELAEAQNERDELRRRFDP